MKPYPHPAPAAVTAADDFTASRARLNEMITHLGSADMMDCTQQMLEEYVTTAGRELQRQLMQDQLDARAAAEVRLEQVTGADGVTRRRAEAGHQRLVATTVGRVEVTRIAYRAPEASNLHPADKLLSLPTRFTRSRCSATWSTKWPAGRCGRPVRRSSAAPVRIWAPGS